MNASPDLAAQINSFSELHPRQDSPRNTPIAGAFLTNADLDHVLGLFALREGGRINIFAPKAVREALAGRFGMAGALESFCGVEWREPGAYGSDWFRVPSRVRDGSPDRVNAELQAAEASSAALACRMIALPGGPPLFAMDVKSGPQSVAYQFRDEKTGRRLLVAPDVAVAIAESARDVAEHSHRVEEINEELLAALKDSDAVIFDGTFWSADDLTHIKPGARTPEEMGHVTIEDGSLDLLAKLPAKRKIYTHINNTNPILAPDSPERKAVEGAGIIVGYDGLEFEV